MITIPLLGPMRNGQPLHDPIADSICFGRGERLRHTVDNEKGY